MVFAIQKLQNDVFCLTEERNYFQTKFLEQVSEISALKDELRIAKKEITKLRQQLMNTSMTMSTANLNLLDAPTSPSSASRGAAAAKKAKDNKDDEDDDDDEASIGSDATPTKQEGEYDEDEDEDHEAKDIRQSAEKLLQWATYRSSVVSQSNTPTTRTVATDHSSVSSSPSIQDFDVPRTIQSASLEDGDKDDEQQQEQEQDEEHVVDDDDMRETARRLLMEEVA